MTKAQYISAKWHAAGAAILAASTINPAFATEGGGSVYPVGVESFLCCALPPPGTYGLVYGQHYTADKVRGNAGQVVTPPSFKVKATAIVPRLVYVSPTPIGEASWALSAILPIVDLNVSIVPGLSQSKSGQGDLVLGGALGWHHSQSLHTVAAVDVFAPTGAYNRTDIANIGRNHWAIQPIYGISYVNPTGFNADAKVMWTFNGKNKDTNYRSGQELIVDYALGWGVGNGLTLGAGGYVYQQLTDDTLNGVKVSNNKGRSFAIGPAFKYDSGKGWFVTAKYQKESSVRNRAEGQAFWMKVVIPF